MMQGVEKAVFSSKVSRAMDNYLGRFGIQDSLWWKLSFYALIIYLLTTCLVMFYRPDFINLTYATAALFTIVFGEYKKRNVYTALIYTAIGIILYDVTWLILFAGVSSPSLSTFRTGMEIFHLTEVAWRKALDVSHLS